MENTKDYTEYVERMKQIRIRYTPDLKKISDADAYSEILVQNFEQISELARENRRFIDSQIKPLLASN